jgi:hypothetical protein
VIERLVMRGPGRKALQRVLIPSAAATRRAFRPIVDEICVRSPLMTQAVDVRIREDAPAWREDRGVARASRDEANRGEPSTNVYRLVERALDNANAVSVNDIHEWGQYHDSRLALHVLAPCSAPWPD